MLVISLYIATPGTFPDSVNPCDGPVALWYSPWLLPAGTPVQPR
jgi:hypothetical protein